MVLPGFAFASADQNELMQNYAIVLLVQPGEGFVTGTLLAIFIPKFGLEERTAQFLNARFVATGAGVDKKWGWPETPSAVAIGWLGRAMGMVRMRLGRFSGLRRYGF